MIIIMREDSTNHELKLLVLDTVEDLVLDFLYYNRKNDEELTVEDIERAFKDKIVTVDEVIKVFKEKLEANI